MFNVTSHEPTSLLRRSLRRRQSIACWLDPLIRINCSRNYVFAVNELCVASQLLEKYTSCAEEQIDAQQKLISMLNDDEEEDEEAEAND